MSNTISLPRRRRLWFTEALVIAAVLAFGGFALMADAKMSPNELASSISDVLGR